MIRGGCSTDGRGSLSVILLSYAENALQEEKANQPEDKPSTAVEMDGWNEKNIPGGGRFLG